VTAAVREKKREDVPYNSNVRLLNFFNLENT
jgi:hypothetical protein